MYTGFLLYVATLTLPLVALSYGLDTYHCTQGTTVNINLPKGTARIITRLSGTSTYGNNLACSWSISTDSNKRLYFKVVESQLQYAPDNANCNSYDHVAFKEDYIADYYDWSNAKVGMYFTWCGEQNPRYFSSKDNGVYLEFYSNERNTYAYRGVTLEVSVFDVGSCPPGWMAESSRQRDYCYTLRDHKESWSDGQLYCNKVQANLVSMEDNIEADFVTAIMQNASNFERHENTWIGLNDIKENSQYKWIDETSSTATYRWRSIPHSSSVYDNCVSMTYHDGKWQEQFCTLSDIQTVIKNKFICKTNKGGATTLYSVPPDNTTKQGKGSDVPVIGIVIGIICGILLLVAMAALCVYCYCCTETKIYSIPSKDEEEPKGDPQGAPLAVIVTGFVLTAVCILVTIIAVAFILRTRSKRKQQRQPIAHTEMAALESGGTRPIVSGSQPQPTAPLIDGENDRDVHPPSYSEAVKS